MATGTKTKKAKTIDTLLWILIIGLSAWAIFAIASNYRSFETFMAAYFSLTPWDLKMMPVGCVCFFLFWRSCKALIFDPCMELINAREQATEGSLTDSSDLLLKSEKLEQEYQEKIGAARIQAMQNKLELIKQTKTDSQNLLLKANQEAEAIIKTAQEKVKSEIASFKSGIEENATAMVDLVTAKFDLKGN